MKFLAIIILFYPFLLALIFLKHVLMLFFFIYICLQLINLLFTLNYFLK